MSVEETISDFSGKQAAILDILKDGRCHRFRYIQEMLFSDQTYENGPNNALTTHVSNIRKKLEPRGQTIVCEYKQRTMWYRWVILLR